VRSQTILSSVL